MAMKPMKMIIAAIISKIIGVLLLSRLIFLYLYVKSVLLKFFL